MSKAGPIVGLVGGTIMLVVNFFQIQYLFTSIMHGYFPTPTLFPRFISLAITLVWAALGIIGAVYSLKSVRWGNTLMLVAAIGAMAGSFIPIFIDDTGYYLEFIFLNGTAMYIDCILLLIGGILGMTLQPRE